MASLKWIKLSIDLFSDERISLLENEPQGERHLLLWFRLLLLAGKLNNHGALILDGVPLTPKRIATIIKKKPSYVAGGMAVLYQNRLLFEENGIYYIPNWEKHQNEDKLERIRENNRLRQQAYRERHRATQAQPLCDGNVTVTHQNKNKKKNKNENIYNINDQNSEFFSFSSTGEEEPVLLPGSYPQAGYEGEEQTQIPSPPTPSPTQGSCQPAMELTVDITEQSAHTRKMIEEFSHTLPQNQQPQEVHRYLHLWVDALQEQGKRLSPTGLSLTLEKLLPMAKMSGLTPTDYLKEVIARGWHNFYPVPGYQQHLPKEQQVTPSSKSYDIRELDQLI